MALLTLPMVAADQPTDIGNIDWSNPITRGLVDALIPFQRRTAKGVPASSVGLSNEAGTAGMSRKSGANLAPDTYMSLGVGLAAPLTHLEFSERLDNSNNRSSGTFVVGTAGFGFLENTALRACVVSAGGSISVISGTPVNIMGVHCVAHVVRSGDQSLYDNGRLLTTATHSGYAPAATAYHVGPPPNETSISNRKRHFLQAVWSRELSKAEIASLAQNPWQIFTPARRRMISTSATPASVSYLLAATPVGYATTPSSVKLERAASLLATPATYSAAPSPVKMAGAFGLAVAPTSFSVVAGDASIGALIAYQLIGSPANYAISPASTVLARAIVASALPATYEVNAGVVNFGFVRQLNANATSYAIQTATVSLNIDGLTFDGKAIQYLIDGESRRYSVFGQTRFIGVDGEKRLWVLKDL